MSYSRSNSGPKGITILFSFLILSYSIWYTFSHLVPNEKSIRVTGEAVLKVQASYGVWDLSVHRKAKYIGTIDKYANVQNKLISDFLVSRGISPDEISTLPIVINRIDEGENKYEGQYGMRVTSKNIDLLETISSSLVDLLKQGVTVQTKRTQYGPFYHFELTKAIEDQLQKKALQNARDKALKIAQLYNNQIIDFVKITTEAKPKIVGLPSDISLEKNSINKQLSYGVTVEYRID